MDMVSLITLFGVPVALGKVVDMWMTSSQKVSLHDYMSKTFIKINETPVTNLSELMINYSVDVFINSKYGTLNVEKLRTFTAYWSFSFTFIIFSSVSIYLYPASWNLLERGVLDFFISAFGYLILIIFIATYNYIFDLLSVGFSIKTLSRNTNKNGISFVCYAILDILVALFLTYISMYIILSIWGFLQSFMYAIGAGLLDFMTGMAVSDEYFNKQVSAFTNTNASMYQLYFEVIPAVFKGEVQNIPPNMFEKLHYIMLGATTLAPTIVYFIMFYFLFSLKLIFWFGRKFTIQWILVSTEYVPSSTNINNSKKFIPFTLLGFIFSALIAIFKIFIE